jgi:FkbM family methyltransferase
MVLSKALSHLEATRRLLLFLKQQHRRIRRLPWIKYVRQEIQIIRMHRRFRPDCVRLPGASNFIFLDPRENRARSTLVNLGSRQLALRELWQRAVAAFDPSIVIDVGLNYGEFLFVANYSPSARLIGIEANDKLGRWPEKSKQAHPNANQIELIYAVAADRNVDRHPFYVDAKWSGRSSACLDADAGHLLRCEVPSITVDSLFESRDLSNDTLLFKIDVEGFEPRVLKGMRRLITTCSRSIGIVELNGRSCKTTIEFDEYISWLRSLFAVYSLGRPGEVTRLRDVSSEILPADTRMQDLKTNLLLLSNDGLLSALSLVVPQPTVGAAVNARRSDGPILSPYGQLGR